MIITDEFWNSISEYFKNKYAADIGSIKMEFSITTDNFSQEFSIFRKTEYNQIDANENQLEIWDLLYGVNDSNRKICEEIAREYKKSKIHQTVDTGFILGVQDAFPLREDYLQTFIDIDENTTAESIDKILNEICDVALKIEDKIKINDETPINKNIIYVYGKPDYSEAKAKDMWLLEKANDCFDKYSHDPDCRLSLNPIKIMKQNKFDNEKIALQNAYYNAVYKFQDDSTKWMSGHYRYTGIPLPTDLHDANYNYDKNASKNGFLKKYKIFLKKLPFLYINKIQELNAKEPNAHFLSVDELNKLRESNKIQFLNVDKFEAGQVFIKHPFLPDTYMSIETSETTLFHIKMQCLSRIMQCLGATSVSGHAYVSETKQRNMDADGHVSYKVVDATGSLSSSQNEKYESDYVLEDTFSGDFTEESYAEALEEAKKVGLYNDFDIKNLLEQRNPKKKNEMKSRKVKIEMTRELNKSLDSAFALQAEGFGMNGTYKEILATQRNVMFELNITF